MRQTNFFEKTHGPSNHLRLFKHLMEFKIKIVITARCILAVGTDAIE